MARVGSPDSGEGKGRIKREAVTAQAIAIDDGDVNQYAQAVDAGHAVDPRLQRIFVACVVLVALYAFALIVPKDILNTALHHSAYNAGYSFAWFVEDLGDNITGLIGVLTGNDTGPAPYAATMIRYVIIAMAGAGLALCGAVYQGSFRNALVSPSTLGVMSGASLGMMLWIVFFVSDEGTEAAWLLDATAGLPKGSAAAYLWSSYSLALISFAGCVLVVGIVLLVMRIGGKGGMNAILMIITGQVIGSILGAVGNTIRYYYVTLDPYGAKATLITDLQIASFYRMFTFIDIVAIGVPLVATFAVVMRLRRRMTLLAFSEGEARSMGVNTRRMQFAVVGLCTLLTAIIVSFCGTVGFVGFLVPHLARRIVGPSFGYLLPAAAVMGAIFVLGAYVLLQMTLGPAYETMVGMFISIGGSAVFLVTALRGKGGARGEFR